MSEEFSGERDSLSYKQLLEQLKVRLDYVWLSAHSPAVSRQELLFSIENMHSKTFSGQVTYLENWRSSIFCTISCQQVSTFRCWIIFLIIWTIQGGIFFRFGDRWRRIRSTRRTTLSTYSTDLPKPKVSTQLCSNYYWTFLQFVAFPSCTASRILCGLCQSWASSCSLILLFLWSR